MQIKLVSILLIIAAVYLHESEAGAGVAKLALIKGKVALAKAPHIIAAASVAKEVKAKTKIAAAKTLAAAKATKIAALSALTAPFRVAKKKIALKIAGFKALKALKLAKIAKTAAILKTLKKGPIIIPVPIAVPIGKTLPKFELPKFELPKFELPKLPEFPNFLNIPPPSVGESSGPIQGFISGAQKAFQSATNSIPFISQLTNSFGSAAPQIANDVPAVAPAPVYRFVPDVGFKTYNKVSYEPQLEIEVPSVVPIAQPVAFPGPVVRVGPVASVYASPIVPQETYGVPN